MKRFIKKYSREVVSIFVAITGYAIASNIEAAWAVWLEAAFGVSVILGITLLAYEVLK